VVIARDAGAKAHGGRRRRDGTTTFFTAAQNVRFWQILLQKAVEAFSGQ
jgi:hypothetical protein